MVPRSVRVGLVIALPILFAVIGCGLGGNIWRFFPRQQRVEEKAYPLPHHFAKYPGNLTFRFAMAHDVIHERFPHHGPAFYRARNREVEQALPKTPPAARGKEADEYFRLLDDQGVGLEFLGQHQQAVDLMRKKLDRQTELGYAGRDLYSTYANLGTFLILWQLSEGVKDVPKAKGQIGESVKWVKKAIEVYPESHFGREVWQVVLEEFLLAALDKPELLLQYDMVGNRLDQSIDPATATCFDEPRWLRPPGSGRRSSDSEPSLAANAARSIRQGESPTKQDVGLFRACIQTVGAEKGWKEAVKTSHTAPVPFDEPALGIVGMWRMGAGANPYFALALGEILLRVGQRYVAWTAYERAHQLREHIWPDAQIQKRFAAHCRARQRLIEGGLPKEDWAAVRDRFNKELAFGKRYQQEYQAYEAKRLQEGARTTDANFYRAFEADREPIATPIGEEDRTFAIHDVTSQADPIVGAFLFGGVFAFLTAAAGTVVLLLLGRAAGGRTGSIG